jgi:hypothetical protein
MSHQPERTTTRWGKAHAWWQTLPDVDLDRWGVLTTLSLYADENGICHPSQATLARALKRSRPWVNRVISDLTEVGLLHKTARTRSTNAGTTSCEYRIVTNPAELRRRADHVTTPTPACHDDDKLSHSGDTPCHQGDTTQFGTKQNNPVRPDARDARCQSVQTERREPQRTVPLPPDWRPSAMAMEAAQGLCPAVNLETHAAMFAAKCRSKGYQYLPDGIDDAWLAWLLEDRLRDDNRRVQPGKHALPRARVSTVRLTPSDIAQQRFEAWAASAAAPPLPTANPWR